MIRKATRAAAALAAAALLLTACSGGGQDGTGGDGPGGTPQTGGTVHMLQNADFSYLDPARGWDGGVNAFYRLIYRGLTMQAAGDAEDPNADRPRPRREPRHGLRRRPHLDLHAQGRA